MSIFLWVLQIVFGILFVLHGLMFIAQPAAMRSTLEEIPYPRGFLQFIGICEVLGGLGLVLPLYLGIAPILTPIAAIGLSIIMLGAAFTHLRAKEVPPGIVTGLFMVLLAAVASWRW